MKLVAFVLASLVFLQACAGSTARTSAASGDAYRPVATEQTPPKAEARRERSVWPWIVGGAAVAAVAFAALVYVAAEKSGEAVAKAAANSAGNSGRGSGPITVAQSR